MRSQPVRGRACCRACPDISRPIFLSAPSRCGLRPTRCFFSPAIRATAAIGSTTACSRSRWCRAPAPSGSLSFLGCRCDRRRIVDDRRVAALGGGRGGARLRVELSRAAPRSRPSRKNIPRSTRPWSGFSPRVCARRIWWSPPEAFCRSRAASPRPCSNSAEHFGQDVGSGRIVIRQKIGQSDIAAMAGIARENVSRILNDWKRRKLVSRLSGYYCLENKAQLEHEAEL